MSKTPLFCIHRNRLVRECLANTLSTSDGGEAFEFTPIDPSETELAFHRRDAGQQIALIDLELPERQAAELTRAVVSLDGRAVLLATNAESGSDALATLVACIEAGAQGYVLEDATVEELLLAIRTVAEGRFYCSPEIAQGVMQELVQLSREYRREEGWENRLSSRTLTERELQILHWIAEGMSNKQVAKKLSLSIYTVKNHVHRILNKLNASDRTHAVRHALEEKWLPLSQPITGS